jgi:hypothetical protein
MHIGRYFNAYFWTSTFHLSQLNSFADVEREGPQVKDKEGTRNASRRVSWAKKVDPLWKLSFFILRRTFTFLTSEGRGIMSRGISMVDEGNVIKICLYAPNLLLLGA